MHDKDVPTSERLLRIKRQVARLAELQTLQSAARFRHAQDLAAEGRQQVDRSAETVGSLVGREVIAETVRTTSRHVRHLHEEATTLATAAETARRQYQAAVENRRRVDAEIEAIEELVARQHAAARKAAEQNKQRAADEWTLRRWKM